MKKLLLCFAISVAILSSVADVKSGKKDSGRSSKAAIKVNGAASNNQQRDAQWLEKRNEELERQVAKMKSQIEELNAEITSLTGAIKVGKEECNVLRDEIAKLVEANKRLSEALKAAVTNKKKQTQRQ